MLIIDDNTERLMVPITKTGVEADKLINFKMKNTATNKSYVMGSVVNEVFGYYDIVSLTPHGDLPTPGEYSFSLIDISGNVQETGILRYIVSGDGDIEFVDLPIYREYIQPTE